MIEPIIDEETFYRAQERLESNVHKAARSKAVEKYILSGNVVCANGQRKSNIRIKAA